MDASLFTRPFVLSLLYLSLLHCVISIQIPAGHHLYSAVYYFETLHKINDIHQRVTRDTLLRPGNNPKIVQFDTLGRNFKLLLHPHTKPFHPHSHVRYDNDKKVPIDVYQFHHGHVIGAESSHVTAHLSHDGIMTAIIMMDDDWYYIEPSDRHFTESHDFHMISYRGSDLKLNMTRKPQGHFCGASHDHHDDIETFVPFNKFNNHTHNDINYKPESSGRLKRRQAIIEASTVCPVKLVATTSFFEHFGASNSDHTINFLLVILLQIDAIFRSTDWEISGVTGSASSGVRGLQIADITIHNSTDNSPTYNSNQGFSSNDFLREFASSDWSDYCLAHIFTARSFTDSTRLGVAYTAFANSLRAGGVCSRRTTFEDAPFSGNVGASTYRASDRFLVLAEAVIVTGHEFGHSWGSGHDPETSECSPPLDINGGKYLMYAFAQDGQSRNNMVFSNCSRQAISFVLNTHESECFVAPSTDRCGDYVINSGEDCDPGPSRILQGGDDCCNDDCTFKMATNGMNYNCSDANHDCCFDCSPSPVGTICREEEIGNMNCFGNRTCNGGITCPDEKVYVQDETSCGIMGECMSSNDDPTVSYCTNFCELNNLTTCFCTGANECMLCCSTNTSSSCIPFDDPLTLLPNGRFCDGGFCDGQGVCVLSDPDLATFLFDLLTDFSTAALVRFIEENIVGVVILLSLVVWIPCSVGVHLFDISREKRRERIKEEEQDEKKKRRKKHKNNEKTPLIEEIDSPMHKAKIGMSFNEGKNPEYDPVTKHVTLV